jgi:hypothetical protein
MNVVFHIGAHQTDHGMLLRSLLKNGDLLLGQEVAVPGPSRYRKLIGEVVNSLRGAVPDEVVQETLYEAVLDIDEPERLVLSSDSFICVPERALENGRLYRPCPQDRLAAHALSRLRGDLCACPAQPRDVPAVAPLLAAAAGDFLHHLRRPD